MSESIKATLFVLTHFMMLKPLGRKPDTPKILVPTPRKILFDNDLIYKNTDYSKYSKEKCTLQELEECLKTPIEIIDNPDIERRNYYPYVILLNDCRLGETNSLAPKHDPITELLETERLLKLCVKHVRPSSTEINMSKPLEKRLTAMLSRAYKKNPHEPELREFGKKSLMRDMGM